jgi:hypothetical protein
MQTNMKRFTLLFLIIIFYSCSDSKRNMPPENVSLSGMVYQTSGGLDSLCKPVEFGTDAFQDVLFVNDSEFVRIVYTCCPADTEDFASQFFYKGNYRVNDTALILTYNPMVGVYYSKEMPNPTGDSMLVASEHIDFEELENTLSVMKRYNCKETPYFMEAEVKKGDGAQDYITPVDKQLSDFKKEMEDKGIWQKLFNNQK